MPTSPRMPRQRRGIKPPLCKGRCQRFALTEGLSLPGEAEPRPYTRLPIAFAPSVRADVGIRPYDITGGVCVIHTGGQSRPPLHTVSRRQNIFNQRPVAATYLCRFAAKARFDNRPNPRVRFPKGRAAALPFGRFKGKRFLRKGGNRNPPFLKPFFGYFLSGKKVTRRRQKGKGQKERKILHGRTEPSAPTTAYRAYALPQNIPIILPHLPPPRNLPSRASFM